MFYLVIRSVWFFFSPFLRPMSMDRYRYFILNQKLAVLWGVLQVACASLCVVCGFIDAAFRVDTTLCKTRAPLWAGLVSRIDWITLLMSPVLSITSHPALWIINRMCLLFLRDLVPVLLYCSHRSWPSLGCLHFLPRKRKTPRWWVTLRFGSFSFWACWVFHFSSFRQNIAGESGHFV